MAQLIGSQSNHTISKHALIKGKQSVDDGPKLGKNYQGETVSHRAPPMFGSLDDNFAELFTRDAFQTVFVDIAEVWSSKIRGSSATPVQRDHREVAFGGRITLLIHGDVDQIPLAVGAKDAGA